MPEEKKLSIPEPVAPPVQMTEEEQHTIGLRVKEQVEMALGEEIKGYLLLAVKADGKVSMIAVEPKAQPLLMRLARAAGSSVDRLLR